MQLAYRSMNLESPCLMSFNDCSIFSLNLIFSYYLKLSLFFYYTGFWWLNTHTHVRSPLWEQSSLILSSSLTGIFLPLQVRLDAPQWLHSWQGATWCRLLWILGESFRNRWSKRCLGSLAAANLFTKCWTCSYSEHRKSLNKRFTW